MKGAPNGRYVTIFPLFFSYFSSSSSSSSSLLHCTTEARARLGVVSSWKIPEKGVGKENRAKMASFWPVPFKIKRAKTTSFWTHKVKKKLGLSPNPLQPDGLKEKEGSEGVLGRRRVRWPHIALSEVSALRLKQRLREGASRCPEPRRAFHNYALFFGSHCIKEHPQNYHYPSST